MGRKKNRPAWAPSIRSEADKKFKLARERKRGGETILKCVDGTSHSVRIGEVIPGTCALTDKPVLAKVVRVDEEIDAVYANEIAGLPMRWWEWNIKYRSGEVTDDDLDHFLATMGDRDG